MSKKNNTPTAEQAAQEQAATEQPAADTPQAPEQAPAADGAAAQNEDAAPAAEQPGADAPPAPEQTPGTDGQGTGTEQDVEPELFTLAELAEKFRLPSWQSAALHRMMEWEPGKQVTEDAYRKAMDGLKTRRMGG